MDGRQAEKKGGRSWPRRGSRTSTRSRCVRSFVRSFQHISRCGVAVARSLAGRARKMAGRFRLT